MLEGVVIDDTELFNGKLQEREDFYNFNRPHGALGGQTPYERLRGKTRARREGTPSAAPVCPGWDSNPHALSGRGV
jgi:transposase InsO family protein